MGINECVHCGLCKDQCLFLQKYHADIGDVKILNDHVYGCFLCGKCTEICPMGIDGRKQILEMRQEQVKENDNRISQKGYHWLLFEKSSYCFSNYKNVTSKSVLFPGCNFVGHYPKTTRYIAKLLREKADIGVIFDCCGKPIAELGLEQKEEEIIEKLNQRLEKEKIEEVIMLCPNCYHFLKPRLKASVVSIYEKLRELGLGKKIKEKLTVFPPCPERLNGEIWSDITYYLEIPPQIITEVQCCGLGGCAAIQEKQLSKEMVQKIGEKNSKINVYCASCAGNIKRNSHVKIEHLLLKILDIEEEPDIRWSMIHKWKTKYWSVFYEK